MTTNPEKLAATKANYECLVSKMKSLKTKQSEIDLKIDRLQKEKYAIQQKRISLREQGLKVSEYLASHGIETELWLASQKRNQDSTS